MADSKITALTALTAADPVNDMFPVVDVSDTSMAASGTTKKISVNNILGASGTATLASATITGDLTVDTSTLKVDSANNRVGIGTASPTVPLYVTGNNATATAIMQDETNGAKLRLLANSINFDLSNGGGGGGISVSGNNPIIFQTNGSEQMRLNSTGLGVGTSPSYKLHVNGTDATNVLFNGATKGVRFVASASKYSITGVDNTGAATFQPLAIGGASLEFQIGSTTQMTLDASGNLLVGTTTAAAKITALAGASGQTAIFQQPAQNFWCVLAHNQATSGDNSFVLFGTEASFTSRGSITYNRAAGQVSYNITSDYRLKEDVKPLTGALNRISSLKPSTYKFKETGFTCEGFIAHELAEVIPAAVTGEKDAVNEDGSIKAQGVDLSKVVPVLVAAIKELAAEVNALKNA